MLTLKHHGIAFWESHRVTNWLILLKSIIIKGIHIESSDMIMCLYYMLNPQTTKIYGNYITVSTPNPPIHENGHCFQYIVIFEVGYFQGLFLGMGYLGAFLYARTTKYLVKPPFMTQPWNSHLGCCWGTCGPALRGLEILEGGGDVWLAGSRMVSLNENPPPFFGWGGEANEPQMYGNDVETFPLSWCIVWGWWYNIVAAVLWGSLKFHVECLGI